MYDGDKHSIFVVYAEKHLISNQIPGENTMTIDQTKNKEAGDSIFGLQPYLLKFVAVVAASLVIIPLLPALLANLLYSFSGHAPKIYWYLSRSAGFVALTFLWMTMALGLGITNKMARLWPGAPTAFAIHEYMSLLGLAFVVYHGLVLIGDHFVDFSLPRLLTPFSIGWKIGDQRIGFSMPRLMDPFSPELKPFWIGLGQVGFYVWVIVVMSFYARKWIGQKTWRVIHYVNFATYIMSWTHGTFTGTDSGVGWVRWYYWISGGSLLILLAYRLYDSGLKKKISLPRLGRGRVPTEEQNSKPSIPRPIVTTAKHLPESLVREQAFSKTASVNKTAMSAVTLSSVSPIIPEVPAQSSQNEKTRPRASETPAPEGQSSPAVAAVIPDSDKKETSSPWIEKYEMGSGKNKINVRIFKEPDPEPVKLETHKDAGRNPAETLVLRLKRDFIATPTRPRPLIPNGHSN